VQRPAEKTKKVQETKGKNDLLQESKRRSRGRQTEEVVVLVVNVAVFKFRVVLMANAVVFCQYWGAGTAHQTRKKGWGTEFESDSR
jgi:hypothetical protein